MTEETRSCSCTGPFTALAIYPGLYTGISRRGCGCSRASIGLSWDPSSALQEDRSSPRVRAEGAELGSARCSLNCTTRALFCLPSSGILIHGSAQAFKVPKTAEIVLSHFRGARPSAEYRRHRCATTRRKFEGPFGAFVE